MKNVHVVRSCGLDWWPTSCFEGHWAASPSSRTSRALRCCSKWLVWMIPSSQSLFWWRLPIKPILCPFEGHWEYVCQCLIHLLGLRLWYWVPRDEVDWMNFDSRFTPLLFLVLRQICPLLRPACFNQPGQEITCKIRWSLPLLRVCRFTTAANNHSHEHARYFAH